MQMGERQRGVQIILERGGSIEQLAVQPLGGGNLRGRQVDQRAV